MEARWKTWSNARSEKAACKVANRLLLQLNWPFDRLSFEPYPKTGGWTFVFYTRLVGASWNDYVVNVIELGQRVAYSWTLYGSVSDDPSGWSTQARTAGVTSIEWQLHSLGYAEAVGVGAATENTAEEITGREV